MEKQRVLIIDDNNENIKVAANIIKDKDNIVWASIDPEEGLKIAKKKQPDLILLDIQMPKINGFEVCKNLKNDDNTRDIPIIFMTARTDEESIEKAYRAGAVDYITKPIKKLELIARVNTHLKISKLIEDLKVSSYTDGLTNLYNHKKIFQMLKIEIDRAKRYKKNLSIMMADIDHFKKVNDDYGHLKGDLVLKKIASCLKNQIREIDIVGRYGGEEFLIVFPEVTREEAKIAAERIRKEVENLKFDEGLKVTISGGLAEYNGEEIQKLIKKADDKLYEAKENGRNQTK
ncbi:MAG: diguanylate cyclase, partial [Fusobacteriota bacterium]